MGFSREEHWNGLPYPSPRDLPDPGIKPVSLTLLQWQVDSLPLAPEAPHVYDMDQNKSSASNILRMIPFKVPKTSNTSL